MAHDSETSRAAGLAWSLPEPTTDLRAESPSPAVPAAAAASATRTADPRAAASAFAGMYDDEGQGLPSGVSRELEASLGVDLGSVRLHRGREANAAAAHHSAHAFAVGQNIFLGDADLDPSSDEGRWLIAHEVAHTVQQRGAAPSFQGKLATTTPGDAAEEGADRFADAFAAGHVSDADRPRPGSAPASVARESFFGRMHRAASTAIDDAGCAGRRAVRRGRALVNEAERTGRNLAERAVAGGRRAVSGAGERVREARETGRELVDRALETGHDVAEGAREGVDRARGMGRRALERADEARRELAEGVDDAGSRVHTWAQDQVRDARRRVNEARRTVGDTVDDARERAGEMIDDVREMAVEGADEAWREAQQTGADARDRVLDYRRTLGERLEREMRERIQEPLREWTEEQVAEHLGDPLEFVDELEPGDTRTLAGGGSLAIGAQASDDAELSLARGDDGNYTLTMGGMLGLGGQFTLGSNNLGGGQGEVMGRGGARNEFQFATAEEARRGIDLLSRFSAHNSVQCISAERSVYPPDFSPEDIQFLHDHASASEFRGELSANITGSLGPRLDEETLARMGGVSLRGSNQVNEIYRVEHPSGPDGPVVAVVAVEVQGAVAARSGPTAGLSSGDTAMAAGLSDLGSATGTRLVRMERRFTLPAGTRDEDMVRDPGMIARLGGTPEERLTLTDTAEGGMGGETRGITHRTQYSREGSLFDDESHPGTLANGGMERGLRDDVQVTESVRRFQRHGTQLNPSVTLGPFALSGRYRNQTTSQEDPTVDLDQTMAERRRT